MTYTLYINRRVGPDMYSYEPFYTTTDYIRLRIVADAAEEYRIPFFIRCEAANDAG